MAGRWWLRGWFTAYLIVSMLPGACSALESGDMVVTPAIGYAAASGSADAGKHRDLGWNFYLAARRLLPHRLTAGAAVEYGTLGLDADSYFAEYDVVGIDAESQLRADNRGHMAYFAALGEVTWDFPVQGSPVPYLTVGGGYYSWTVDAIVRLAPYPYDPDLDDFPTVPVQTMIPDESAIGLRLGGGVRFPLGESRGIWAEFAVHILKAEGGTLVLRPLRLGISLP